eukprot:TRINITY_DN18678_c0_g1_i1.p1 TRINITY_DN18678_c0_g1~~TRINITY_DN18678_c0_g1_i1.p1  ORF type:complete len:345 (-),score=78.11 TRINITY_DN18678_c0_g1_i1:68-985(-)
MTAQEKLLLEYGELAKKQEASSMLFAGFQDQRSRFCDFKDQFFKNLERIESLRSSPVDFFMMVNDTKKRITDLFDYVAAVPEDMKMSLGILNSSGNFKNGYQLRLSAIRCPHLYPPIIPQSTIQVDSLILQGEECRQLFSWFDCGTLNLHLLYRGSRDGFEASTFHRLCDYKGPTLTVVQTTNGSILGGFSPISWKCTDKWQCTGGKSWIFSLKNSTIGPFMLSNKITDPYGIYCFKSFGPTFGVGSDVYIADGCNRNTCSYTAPGASYDLSSIDLMNFKPEEIFSGSRNFQVTEIEIFMPQMDD